MSVFMVMSIEFEVVLKVCWFLDSFTHSKAWEKKNVNHVFSLRAFVVNACGKQ